MPGCALLEPLVVVDLLDDAEHLSDLLSRHLQAVLPEQLLHLVHTDRIAPICVQLVEHVCDLLGGLDLAGPAIVPVLQMSLFLRRPGQVPQPIHDDLILKEGPALLGHPELLRHCVGVIRRCHAPVIFGSHLGEVQIQVLGALGRHRFLDAAVAREQAAGVLCRSD